MGLFCCIFTLWPGESGWHHRGNTNINVSTLHSGCLVRNQRRCDWSARTNVREKGYKGKGGRGAKLNQPFDCAGCHPSAVDQNNMVHCNCTHKHGQRTPRTTRKEKQKCIELARAQKISILQARHGHVHRRQAIWRCLFQPLLSCPSSWLHLPSSSAIVSKEAKDGGEVKSRQYQKQSIKECYSMIPRKKAETMQSARSVLCLH